MKTNFIVAALLCLTIGTPIYSFAADPCEVILCMYGKATGNRGGSDCSSAERAFFKIKAFKKHHFFSPGKTLDMRKAILGECEAADPESIRKILSRFGRMKG